MKKIDYKGYFKHLMKYKVKIAFILFIQLMTTLFIIFGVCGYLNIVPEWIVFVRVLIGIFTFAVWILGTFHPYIEYIDGLPNIPQNHKNNNNIKHVK